MKGGSWTVASRRCRASTRRAGPSAARAEPSVQTGATVEALLADIESLSDSVADADGLVDGLQSAGHRVVDFTDWERIDGVEAALGASVGKLRQKLTRISEMLEAARAVPL